MKSLIFILPFLAFSYVAFAQQGCTDARATNFDLNAVENDGSCVYEQTSYTLDIITALPEVLRESSGLSFTDNQLWTHNDSGNENILYHIDSLSGEVQFTVTLSLGENEDWEDMAESDTHVFIGDFGNNEGDRTDLRIYKVPKSNLNQAVAISELITFSWPDQTDFTPNPLNHNFDCEAFFYFNDSLHLFSKNWEDNQTKHYVLPAEAGDYVAEQKETFNAGGLITSADVSEDGVVILLGYTQTAFNFFWLLFDYPDSNFFSGNKRKIDLGSFLNNSQTEAVVFRENGYGYVSAEVENIFNQRLMSFQTSQWTDPIIVGTDNLELDFSAKAFPNPFQNEIIVKGDFKNTNDWVFKLYNQVGEELHLEKGTFREDLIELQPDTHLPKGIYFLTARSGLKLMRFKLMK